MKVLSLALFVMLFASAASAATTLLWTKNYSIGFDMIYGATTDKQNNLLVVGSSSPPQPPNKYGGIILKYDSNGNQLWTKRYDASTQFGEIAFDVATDSQNNVIATGNAPDIAGGFFHFFTIKYDSNGNQLWNRTYVASISDNSHAVTVDGQDNILIVGSATDATQPASGTDFFVIKYDSSGNLLWTRNYSCSNLDAAREVTTDSQNNIIVTGECQSMPGMPSTITMKYDSSGNVLWSNTYSTGNSNFPRGIFADSQNNLVVAGFTTDPMGSSLAFMLKYDSSGNTIWMKNYSVTQPIPPAMAMYIAYNLAKAPQDGFVITGIRGAPMPGIPTNITILRFDSGGNLLWQTYYPLNALFMASGGSGFDSQGNLYTSFSAINATGTSGDPDIVLLKYGELLPLTVSKITPASVTQNITSSFFATANSGAGVVNCSFYWGGQLLGIMTKSGEVFNYTYRPASAGTFNVFASCVDGAGSTLSNPTDVVVSPVSITPLGFKLTADQGTILAYDFYKADLTAGLGADVVTADQIGLTNVAVVNKATGDLIFMATIDFSQQPIASGLVAQEGLLNDGRAFVLVDAVPDTMRLVSSKVMYLKKTLENGKICVVNSHVSYGALATVTKDNCSGLPSASLVENAPTYSLVGKQYYILTGLTSSGAVEVPSTSSQDEEPPVLNNQTNNVTTDYLQTNYTLLLNISDPDDSKQLSANITLDGVTYVLEDMTPGVPNSQGKLFKATVSQTGFGTENPTNCSLKVSNGAATLSQQIICPGISQPQTVANAGGFGLTEIAFVIGAGAAIGAVFFALSRMRARVPAAPRPAQVPPAQQPIQPEPAQSVVQPKPKKPIPKKQPPAKPQEKPAKAQLAKGACEKCGAKVTTKFCTNCGAKQK